MTEQPPLLVRVLLAMNRMMSVIWRSFVVCRDEVLWAWTSQAGRERTNRAIYGSLKTYFPGSPTFEEGLFDWEREAIASPCFPRSGRILLGAAGGGRELAALCRMGYKVLAFEPSAPLAEAARAVASPYANCRVIGASFEDVLQAVNRGSGPLALRILGVDFDAVVLGWTSFSYVWREQREPLLNAIRCLAPHASLLLSYLEADGGAETGLPALRRWVRRALQLSGASRLAQPGDGFEPWMGYFQAVTPEEVCWLAERTGYRPVSAKSAGHALLVPFR